MPKINTDELFLILKYLQDDYLFPSLLVNRTWCRIIVPILWKNPWKHLKKRKEELLLNLIISHLPKEKGHSYRKPLFDYVSHCKHLDLCQLDSMIKRTKTSTLKNEILGLFINENTKITHLGISENDGYPIHLIPGAEICLSELEFLSCSVRSNKNVLIGLSKICQSIKKLKFSVNSSKSNNSGVSENILLGLIENAKGLNEITIESSDYVESLDYFGHFQNFNRFARTVANNFDTKKIVRAIYQNCPNLKYLKISLHHNSVLELEKLLNNCQCLEGLYIQYVDQGVDCKYLFKILGASSPNSLYKFKFKTNYKMLLESFKDFFYYWKARNPMLPMLLQIIGIGLTIEQEYLFRNYKDLGVIKDYSICEFGEFQDFEWLKPALNPDPMTRRSRHIKNLRI